MSRVRTMFKRAVEVGTGQRVVDPQRHHILPRTYYAPVPDPDELRETDWERRSALSGIVFDLDDQARYLCEELAPYFAEFDPPLDGAWDGGRYFVANRSFESFDAEVYYALLRRVRPKRVVELGSGFSTLVAIEALRRNDADGAPCVYDVYDPFPRGNVPADALRQHPVRAQDVPMETFASLDEGDVLFVDTTHTVRMAGDVNRVVLDILPLLSRGVFVHFHDIWLPYEYHRQLVAEMGFWAEQYLLQAYLADNRRFEVLIAAQALVRERPHVVKDAVPRLAALGTSPSSFWLRTVAGPLDLSRL